MNKLLLILLLALPFVGRSQGSGYNTTSLTLNNLENFSNPSPNWKIAGAIAKTNYDDASIKAVAGTGVLYNDFTKEILFKDGTGISTKIEHGDIYLSLDFLMPKGSNAGIYLQSRYEIQLEDSWLKKKLTSADCGSVYERWEDSKPEGQKGYEGHAPQANGSFAPNVWQHIEIEFQAPRFDANGKKVKPASFKKVILNGVVVQQNVIVSGPTRSAPTTGEKSLAPLFIQGDHGPVAIRNIQYALLNDFTATLTGIKYSYYEGKFDNVEQLKTAKLTRTGNTDAIDAKLADNPNALGLVFSATLHVPVADDYTFSIPRNGFVQLVVDGQIVSRQDDRSWDSHKALTAGDHSFQLTYIKNHSWGTSRLGLLIGKPNSRPLLFHAPASLPHEQPAPLITVAAKSEPEVVRSFMMHNSKKKTQVISVGTPGGLNYAYDLDQAALLKVWRGEFLDVSEMWYERGEPQLAAPLGSSIELTGTPVLASNNVTLPDTLDYVNSLLYKGYKLNDKRIPIYKYQFGTAIVNDEIIPREDGRGLIRRINVDNSGNDVVYVRLAKADSIEKGIGNIYIVGDQKYFIQLSDGSTVVPEIKVSGAQKELIVPCSSKSPVEFSLIW